MKIDFKEKKGFICDMDGVLYHGNKLLPGAADFIHWLQENEKEYLFLTNNSGMTPKELQQKLERLGVHVPFECALRCRNYHERRESGLCCSR